MTNINIRKATEIETLTINWRPVKPRKLVTEHIRIKELDENVEKALTITATGQVAIAEFAGERIYSVTGYFKQDLATRANGIGKRVQTQQMETDKFTYSKMAIREVPTDGISPLQRLEKYFA